MTSPQEAKLNMYDAVISFCEKNNELIDSMPALQSAFSSFKDAVEEIENVFATESLPISGITVTKEESRKALVHQAFTIANALFAYAVVAENNELKKQVGMNESGLLRLKGEELPAVCMNILNLVQTNLTALAGYNITATTVKDFNELVNRYKAVLPRGRNAATQRSSQLTLIKTLFRKTDSILRNQMDKMITRYILSNPSFYSNYAGNRAIIDPGTTPTQIKGTIIDSNDSTPINSAQIRILENETVVTTGGRGRYMIKPLKPGTYSLKITKEGFEEKTVTGLLVKLGQITTIDAVLSRVAGA